MQETPGPGLYQLCLDTESKWGEQEKQKEKERENWEWAEVLLFHRDLPHWQRAQEVWVTRSKINTPSTVSSRHSKWADGWAADQKAGRGEHESMQTGKTWWPDGTRSQEMGWVRRRRWSSPAVIVSLFYMLFCLLVCVLFQTSHFHASFIPSPCDSCINHMHILFLHLCFVFPLILFCHSQWERCSERGDYHRHSAADGCRWGCAGLMLLALQAQTLHCVCLNVLIVTLYSTHLPCCTSLSGTFTNPSSLCPLFLRPRVSDGKMSGGGRGRTELPLWHWLTEKSLSTDVKNSETKPWTFDTEWELGCD